MNPKGTGMEEWLNSLNIRHVEAATATLALVSGSVMVWRRCKMTERMQALWNSTFGRTQVQLDGLNATLGILMTKLDDVRHEVQFNNGSSMKDMARRILALNNARMDADPRAIFLADREGHVYWTNRAHQAMTGFSLNRVGHDGWVNVLHPDHREPMATKWYSAVKHKRDFSEDILYQHHGKPDYWVHVEAFRQMDAGKIMGYYGVVTHIDGPSNEH